MAEDKKGFEQVNHKIVRFIKKKRHILKVCNQAFSVSNCSEIIIYNLLDQPPLTTQISLLSSLPTSFSFDYFLTEEILNILSSRQ